MKDKQSKRKETAIYETIPIEMDAYSSYRAYLKAWNNYHRLRGNFKMQFKFDAEAERFFNKTSEKLKRLREV